MENFLYIQRRDSSRIKVLLKKFNSLIAEGIFPAEMKVVDITPAYKKRDRTDKNNYRPISTLPNISKDF